MFSLRVKRWLKAFCFLGCLPLLACASDPTSTEEGLIPGECSILFIGNSLTFYNDLPGIVRSMAEAAGKTVFVDDATMGGASLADHAINSRTRDKLDQQPWDFVILQDAAVEVAFPEIHSEIYGPIESLETSILSNNPNARIFYFLDYSARDGLLWNGEVYTYTAAQQMLYEGTLALAESLDLLIAPVGWAWNTVRRDRPDIDLYDWDGGHPSYLGSYLSASVYFATIFQETAVGNTYEGDASSEIASYLQTVGSQMVLDSLNLWRLPPMDRICTEAQPLQ